jgi:hypothetical protein
LDTTVYLQPHPLPYEAVALKKSIVEDPLRVPGYRRLALPKVAVFRYHGLP